MRELAQRRIQCLSVHRSEEGGGGGGVYGILRLQCRRFPALYTGIMSSEALLGNPALFVSDDVNPKQLAQEYLHMAKK
jgi:hypothetical protein